MTDVEYAQHRPRGAVAPRTARKYFQPSSASAGISYRVVHHHLPRAIAVARDWSSSARFASVHWDSERPTLATLASLTVAWASEFFVLIQAMPGFRASWQATRNRASALLSEEAGGLPAKTFRLDDKTTSNAWASAMDHMRQMGVNPQEVAARAGTVLESWIGVSDVELDAADHKTRG